MKDTFLRNNNNISYEDIRLTGIQEGSYHCPIVQSKRQKLRYVCKVLLFKISGQVSTISKNIHFYRENQAESFSVLTRNKYIVQDDDFKSSIMSTVGYCIKLIPEKTIMITYLLKQATIHVHKMYFIIRIIEFYISIKAYNLKKMSL